jgi:four helix bundle protein
MNISPVARSYQNLRAYRRAEAIASDLFWLTRRFPNEERHALSVQLRQLARTIPQHIAQGWARRHEEVTLGEHLRLATDACQQLAHWLNVAHACRCLTATEHSRLMQQQGEVARLLGRLLQDRSPASA